MTHDMMVLQWHLGLGLSEARLKLVDPVRLHLGMLLHPAFHLDPETMYCIRGIYDLNLVWVMSIDI